MTLHETFTIILLSVACYVAVILITACVIFPLMAYIHGGYESMLEVLSMVRVPAQAFGLVWGVLVLILTMMGDI